MRKRRSQIASESKQVRFANAPDNGEQGRPQHWASNVRKDELADERMMNVGKSGGHQGG